MQFQDLMPTLLSAFTTSLKTDLPKISGFAEPAFQTLIDCWTQIQQLKDQGAISESAAKTLFDMERNTAQSDLLTIEGFTTLALQDAFNAAINAVKTAVNTSIGWSIL